MEWNLISLLVVGVPGLCLLIGGAVGREYLVAVLGGALVIVSVYRFGRRHMSPMPGRDLKKQRLSFSLAGITGGSLAIVGFASHRYWLAGIDVAILVGALLQLYRTRLSSGR